MDQDKKMFRHQKQAFSLAQLNECFFHLAHSELRLCIVDTVAMPMVTKRRGMIRPKVRELDSIHARMTLPYITNGITCFS